MDISNHRSCFGLIFALTDLVSYGIICIVYKTNEVNMSYQFTVYPNPEFDFEGVAKKL